MSLVCCFFNCCCCRCSNAWLCFNKNWKRQYKCSGCNQIVAYREAK
jgi:hypothetical protein